MPNRPIHISRVHTEYSQQRGSALIVALVMLLLITLIAVAGMQTTILQERMSANLHDRDLAFQAAEAALRDAEALLANSTPVFNNANGLYDLNNANRPVWVGAAIDEGNGSRVFSGNLTGVFAQPDYFIEKIGTFYPPGYDLDASAPPPPVAFFKITARGVGGTPETVVVVNSVYRNQ